MDYYFSSLSWSERASLSRRASCNLVMAEGRYNWKSTGRMDDHLLEPLFESYFALEGAYAMAIHYALSPKYPKLNINILFFVQRTHSLSLSPSSIAQIFASCLNLLHSDFSLPLSTNPDLLPPAEMLKDMLMKYRFSNFLYVAQFLLLLVSFSSAFFKLHC